MTQKRKEKLSKAFWICNQEIFDYIKDMKNTKMILLGRFKDNNSYWLLSYYICNMRHES